MLGYLPNCGTQIPLVVESDEQAGAAVLIRESMYDVRLIIFSIVDQGTFFEIDPLWGRAVVIGLAGLGGVVANNAEVGGGALDARGSQKLRQFKFCVNLPVLQFVAVPDYAERQATMRWGVELTKAYHSTRIAIFSHCP